MEKGHGQQHTCGHGDHQQESVQNTINEQWHIVLHQSADAAVQGAAGDQRNPSGDQHDDGWATQNTGENLGI